VELAAGLGQNCQTSRRRRRSGSACTTPRASSGCPIRGRPAQEAARRAAEAAKLAARTTHSFKLDGYLGIYDIPEGGLQPGQKLTPMGNLRSGETIGVTGETESYRWPSGLTEQLVKVVWKDTGYCASEGDFQGGVGQAYPAGQGTVPSFRTAERGRQRVSDSW